MTTPDAAPGDDKPDPDAFAVLALAAARLIEIFLPLIQKPEEPDRA